MLENVIFKATREKTPNICDRSPHSCTDAMVCLLLKMNKVYIFTITLEWLDLAPKRKIFFRQYNGIFTMWCRKYKQIWPFLTEIAPKIVKKKHESRARFLWFVFTDNETHFHGKPDQRLRQTFPLISDVKHTHDQLISSNTTISRPGHSGQDWGVRRK